MAELASARRRRPDRRPAGGGRGHLGGARASASRPRAGRSCCRCCTDRSARTAPCRACWSWPDVPYVGSGVLGSALAMDKAMAKQVLAHHGIEQARWLGLHRARDRVAHRGDRGDAARPAALRQALQHGVVGRRHARRGRSRRWPRASASRSATTSRVVVEEAVVGREIEVAVLGNEEPRASVPGEIVPGHEFYDYEDKYLDDGARLLVPAPLDEHERTEVRAPRRRGVLGASVRRHGPHRLLLRGRRAWLPLQRGQHHPRVHADLDVPEAVAGERACRTRS